MNFASFALAALLIAALPPPIPPEQDISPPPPRPPAPKPAEGDKSDKNKATGPDPAYVSLLPDDGSPWGLAPELAARLATVADKYRAYAVKFTCTETVRKAKFDDHEAYRGAGPAALDDEEVRALVVDDELLPPRTRVVPRASSREASAFGRSSPPGPQP